MTGYLIRDPNLQTAVQLWQDQEMIDCHESVLAELNSLTNDNDNLS